MPPPPPPPRTPADPPPCRVLAVDDDALQRLMLAETLDTPHYRVQVAESGEEALALLARERFDVVLLDRHMPGLDGDSTCRRIRSQPALAQLPVLMVTGSSSSREQAESLAAGADDMVRKPYTPLELQVRIDTAVRRKRAAEDLDQADALLFALARLVEAKDGASGDHCTRVALLAERLGRSLHLGAGELQALRRGSVLHDLGKLGVPDAVLAKPGPLDVDGWRLMQRHPLIGADLVGSLRSMQASVPIVRHHHERWDGSGYPDGLAGERIPLLARVFQVADIYDALVHARPWRPPFARAAALQTLEAEARCGWRDPRVVRAFIALMQEPGSATAPATDAATASPTPAAKADDLGASLYRRVAHPALSPAG